MQNGTKLLLVLSLTSFTVGITQPGWSADSTKQATDNAKVTSATATKIQAKTEAQDASATHAEKIVNGEAPAATPEKKKQASDTAKVVNQVPGVNVTPAELTPPDASPPIKGFHPIKRALKPIVDMEAMVVKLQQQIMSLEGPIAGLNPPMVALQGKMGTVNTQITQMQSQLTRMEQEVTGVRSDLAHMERSINRLEQPINSLRGPIQQLQKPLSNVAKPLVDLQTQLNWIIFAIACSAAAISIGTPIAGILIYVNRRKLFPQIKEQEMPKVEPGVPASTRR